MPITIFAIHGNHEQRLCAIAGYQEKTWRGGTVYLKPQYPNLLFAKGGEVFEFDGKHAIVIGGVYSIDKDIRLMYGWGWWEDEQPSKEIKRYVEQQLLKINWKVDVVLSHTTPLKYEPVEVFISGVDQSRIDKSTEIWLDRIEDKLTYGKWYCGHYHTEKKLTSWKLCLKILMSSVDGREIRTSLNALSVGV